MKRGFTLVELLAVIIILGIVGTIIGMGVNNSLKMYSIKLCNNMITDIKDAANTWAANNMLILPTKEYDNTDSKISYEDILNGNSISTDDYHTLTIKLSYLQKNGYIESEIKNPITKEDVVSDKKNIDMDINIVYKNNKYIYELDETICEVEE